MTMLNVEAVTVFSLQQLRDACRQPGHGLAGYYNGGELYVNDERGATVFQEQVSFELAESLCEELGLTLTEV
jgi:hypothetical protein